MWNHVKVIYLAAGYLTRPAKLREKGRFINEMRLSTGFMNEVTSRFVPPLCSRQDNKVYGAVPQTQKRPSCGSATRAV